MPCNGPGAKGAAHPGSSSVINRPMGWKECSERAEVEGQAVCDPEAGGGGSVQEGESEPGRLVRSRSKQWGEWGGRVFRELRDLGVGDSRGVGGSGGCVSDRGMRAPERIVVG